MRSDVHMCVTMYFLLYVYVYKHIHIKGLREAGFGPQPAGARRPWAAAGWMLYLLRGGAVCGPDQCGAGRAAGQVMVKYSGRAAGQDI